MELEKFIEPPLALPQSLLINSLAGVDDVASLVLRIEAHELCFVALLDKIVVLIENLLVHAVITVILAGVLGDGLSFLVVRHLSK